MEAHTGKLTQCGGTVNFKEQGERPSSLGSGLKSLPAEDEQVLNEVDGRRDSDEDREEGQSELDLGQKGRAQGDGGKVVDG